MYTTQKEIETLFSYYDNSLLSASLADLVAQQSKCNTSKSRLVICGSDYELYSYERPYAYNYPPKPRPDFVKNLDLEAPRRADNLFAVRQKIRRIINANKNAYGQIPKFITYTFAENETELSRANTKFRDFHKRLEYKIGKFKYLAVVEFQNKRAQKYNQKATIHYHVLYFSLPYIKGLKDIVQKAWGMGFIKVIAVKKIRNVGAYVCKYLQKEIIDTRLRGQKCYFTSKGLYKPIELKVDSNIVFFLSGCILQEENRKTYESQSYGNIIYQQGTLNLNQNHAT